MKPLAIDLFCGLGGWTEGLLAEGYDVIGFDITRHVYGEHRYPAQLVLQDVRTLHGRQFKDASLIVASPPCQEYSWMAMPWKAAKERARQYRSGELDVRELTELFDAAVRIGREAGVPTVIENVRGAQPWVGRSRWHYGSYHLWGDVPALMPMTVKGVKVGGLDWKHPSDPRHRPGQAFNPAAQGRALLEERAYKNAGGSWFRVSHNNVPHSRGDAVPHTPHMTNPDEHVKLGGSWFHGYRNGQGPRNHGSKSTKRKMASALIAKIPFALSSHIARVYRPLTHTSKGD